MVSVEKRGDGYTVRWRDASGRQRSQQVGRWRDAVTLDGEMKRLKAIGELALRDRGSTTLEDFWDTWWALHAPTLSATARENYEIAWRCHIRPVLGRYQLKLLTGQEIMRLSSSGLAAATIRKHYTVLQAMLSAAMAWGYVATNAAAGVKKPPLPQSRGVALSLEQVEALVAELGDERSKALVRVLAYTGLRPGELRALRWEDVSGGSVNVRFSKTARARMVLLNQHSSRALVTWRVASSRPPGWAQVFPDRKGGTWSEAGYKCWVKRSFAPAAARAGLKGLRAYDLRHTFVSQLIAAGEDIYWIARQAGHSPEVALRTYAHLIEGRVGAREVREPTANPSNPQALCRTRTDDPFLTIVEDVV